jgi:colanic acid/amylovoran biosynthesis protein
VLASPVKKLIPAALVKSFLKLDVGTPNVRKVLKAYSEADVVIDIWGIGFTDSIGKITFRGSFLSGGRFLIGKILGKPVVKYTADLGPFESRWNRLFSKFYFNQTVDLILARSNKTRERLVMLGVKTPIVVCPDTAFLLETETSTFAETLAKEKEDRPIIGLSVSHMAAWQSANRETYIQSMAQLADYVIENIGARVIFIPNEISPRRSVDDTHISQLVMEKMKRKPEGILVPVEGYTPQQVKAIIGQCDVVIAARYHTIIASLSQGIPVLAIGWHAKYAAALSLVGQDEYICPVRSLELDNLMSSFDDLWQSRERIKEKINNAIPDILRAIIQGGKEVGLLLSKRQYIQ